VKKNNLLKDRIRKRAQNDDTVGYVLRVLYCLFKNPLSKHIIYILFPIIISLETVLIQNFRLTSPGFLLTFGIFVIFIYISYWVDEHNKNKWRDIKLFQKALEGLSAVSDKHADEYKKQNIIIAKDGRSINYDDILIYCGFMSVSGIVCSMLIRYLTTIYPDTSFTIAVYQYFKIDGTNKSIYKMIAGRMQDNNVPDKLGKIYQFSKHSLENMPYHQKIFKEEKIKIRALVDKNEVDNKLKTCTIQEDKEINQCIIIPVKIDTKIMFFLHIETDKPYLFGKSKDEMKELTYNIFCPYVNYLKLNFEIYNMLETISKKNHI